MIAHRFSSRNFRDMVRITPIAYGQDDDGAAIEIPGTPVELACRVEFNQPNDPTRRLSGVAPSEETVAEMIFRGRPSVVVATETLIEHISGGGGDISPPDQYRSNGTFTDRGSGLFGLTAVRR